MDMYLTARRMAMYYYRVYQKFMYHECVYVSELFDSKSEAEEYARSCEDDEHFAIVFEC